MLKVFLGGTCNESTWREELIPMLKIPYFNPVVEDWTPECQKEEERQKKECDYHLYVITPKMTGVFSIAEVVNDSCKMPARTLLCILPADGDKRFDTGQERSLDAVREMVYFNGAWTFNLLDQVARKLNTHTRTK